EEHDRERALERQQYGTSARTLIRSVAHPGAERAGEIAPHREHGWPKGRGQPRRERACTRHTERSPIGHDVGRPLGEYESSQCCTTPLRDENAGSAAKRRQHQTLSKELSDQPTPAHTEREANRKLTTPAEDSSEHEIADVRARDEQHDRGNARKPEQRMRFEPSVGSSGSLERSGD